MKYESAESRLQGLFSAPAPGTSLESTSPRSLSNKMSSLREIFEKKLIVQTEPLTYRQFHITMPGVTVEKDRTSGNKHTTYHLSIQFSPIHDGKEIEPVFWKQSHRFSDWEAFHNTLGEILSIQFVDFPSKKMLGASTPSTDKRKIDLMRFLEAVMYFDDVLNSNIFKNFIHFDDYYPPASM